MKKSVILVHKLRVAGLSRQQTEQQLYEYIKMVQLPPKDDIEITNYVLPVYYGDNDIVTLYPEHFGDDSEYKERVDEIIKQLEEITEPFQPVTVKRKRKFNKIKFWK